MDEKRGENGKARGSRVIPCQVTLQKK